MAYVLSPQQKLDKKAYAREWRKRNRKRLDEYNKNYWRSRPERRREVCKRYRRSTGTDAVETRGVRSSKPHLIRGFTKQVRRKLFVRCYYCGRLVRGSSLQGLRRTNIAQIEHVLSLSNGGEHEAYNLCVSCSYCNGKKKEATIFAFARRMAKKPGQMIFGF